MNELVDTLCEHAVSLKGPIQIIIVTCTLWLEQYIGIVILIMYAD